MEYKCEVKELITNEEVKIRGISPTQFPLKQRSQEAGPGEKSEGDIGEPRKDVRVDEKGWPLYVVLTNGVVFGCDLVVSATGVTPSIGDLEVEGGKLDLAEDGGVRVDKEMRTSVPDVYAAGDVCSVEWGHHSPLWFQVICGLLYGSIIMYCMNIDATVDTSTTNGILCRKMHFCTFK